MTDTLHIGAFTLPLSVDAWRSALAKGQGRAILELREFGLRPELKPHFLEAVRRDLRFDPFIEEERSRWLFEIADASGLVEEVRDIVVAELDRNPGVAGGDASQYAYLGVVLARRGDRGAESVLRSYIDRVEQATGDIEDCLRVALDGDRGLIQVAREFGRMCLDDDADVPSLTPPWVWVDEGDQDSARRLLEAEATHDELIAAYLAYLNEDEDEQGIASKRPSQLSVQRVMAIIRSPGAIRTRHELAMWGRRARASSLRRILDALDRSDDVQEWTRFLQVFRLRAAPELRPRFFDLARREEPELRMTAIEALRRSRDDRVRDFALECLRSKQIAHGELRLLERNMRRGDGRIVEAALDPEVAPDTLHDVCTDILSLDHPYEVDLTRDPEDLDRRVELRSSLLFVYEHSPCAYCRKSALRHVLEHGGAPDWVLAEARFDSEPDTRAAIKSLARTTHDLEAAK